MITSHDLDRLGKQVAEKFLSDDIALTESLTKVASDKGLNKQQINRVAEAANVEAYLELMKKASDKYIDFALADPTVVHEKVASTEPIKESNYSDYEQEPVKDDISIFEMYKEHLGEENFSKTASVEDSRTESEVRQELYELKGTLDFLDDNLRESVMTIEQSFDKLAFCTKQEVLDNTPFNNVKYVVEYAAPKAGEKIAQDLVEKYTEVMPHIDFEKEATYKGTPNVNSEIYKLAKHIESEAERACKINDAIVHYNDKHNDLAEKHELPKYARVGMIRTIGRGIINFFKKHPMLSGAAVGGALAYGSGKKKGQEEQGAILKNYYEERRPSAHQPVFRRVR